MENLDNRRVHATTVVAVTYRDGAIIAADMQATLMGNLNIYHEPIKKLIPVGRHAIVGIAGLPDVMFLAYEIQKFAHSWRRKLDYELTLDGSHNLLAKNLPAFAHGIPSSLILAGYDTEYRRGRIFLVSLGMNIEIHSGYEAIGSGGDAAIRVFKESFRPELEFTAAKATVLAALHESHKDNAGVGSKYDVYAIDAQGCQLIASAEQGRE